MPHPFQFTRRLASFGALLGAVLAFGCSDAPTAAADTALRPASLDPSLAISTSAAVGQRIITDRYVQVFALPSRSATVIGTQRDHVYGRVVEGPSAVTMTEPYPLFRIDFDAGTDGWALGAYLSLTAAPPPTTTVAVATVTVSPASASVLAGGTVQLSATTRSGTGEILTGRVVTWTTSNAAVATVSATGNVLGVASGSATITATSEGRSGTATVTVSTVITPPPPPPPTTGSAVFASRWGTATGTSQSAYLDSGNPTPWGFVCCSSNSNSAISTAASLGLADWPVANVYRVGMQAGASGIQTHQIQVDLGAPSANSHRYFRYYLQVPYGDDHGTSSESTIEHGVETTSATNSGGRGLNLMRLPRNDGTWFPVFRDIASGWRYVASGLRLAKNRTYRMEWHATYLASTYSIQVRIYDAAGTLVATENDFFQYLPVRNTSARLGAITFPYVAADHRYFRVGTNGPSSNFPMANLRTDNLFLHGAMAVCTTGWCGPVAP
jgi:hypothetical protein